MSDYGLKPSDECVGETIEFEPERFEVRCSIHGPIFRYGTNTVRHYGVKELQRQINSEWEAHKLCVKPQTMKPWDN